MWVSAYLNDADAMALQSVGPNQKQKHSEDSVDVVNWWLTTINKSESSRPPAKNKSRSAQFVGAHG